MMDLEGFWTLRFAYVQRRRSSAAAKRHAIFLRASAQKDAGSSSCSFMMDLEGFWILRFAYVQRRRSSAAAKRHAIFLRASAQKDAGFSSC